MNDAQRSGMRGMERSEKPAERPGDNMGNIGMHVHTDQSGDHHFNLTTAVNHLEQQASGPHDNRSKEFGKPNADKFAAGATKDSAKDAAGNENG